MLVLIVAVYFLLSLAGAYVLFAILKSSAWIKRADYQAGGALAGFLLIFGTLAITHHQLAAGKADGDARDKAEARVVALEQELAEKDRLCEFDHWTIKGTVVRKDREPRRHRGIKVSVLPHQFAHSKFDGRFTLRNIKLARAELNSRELQFSSEGYYPEDLKVDLDKAVIKSEEKLIELQEPVELWPEDPDAEVVDLEQEGA